MTEYLQQLLEREREAIVERDEVGARKRDVDEEIERRQKRIARERGFVIQEHALYLYAECNKPDCPHRAEGESANHEPQHGGA